MKHLTLIDKAFLLKRTTLFSSLDLDMLLIIADKLVLAAFDSDEYLFVAGEQAHRMYFIVTGAIDLYSVSQTHICRLERGDFFGEESLFNNRTRAYSVLSASKTEVLSLSRSNLFTIISEYPSVALGFLQVYTSVLDVRPSKMKEGNAP